MLPCFAVNRRSAHTEISPTTTKHTTATSTVNGLIESMEGKMANTKIRDAAVEIIDQPIILLLSFIIVDAVTFTDTLAARII